MIFRVSLILFVFFQASLFAQEVEVFDIVIKEITLEDAPEIQSFIIGNHNGKWLMIGGRTDGLHRRQPWAAFQPDGKNLYAYVIDPAANEVKSTTLTGLSTSIQEQLQSTNMEFEQLEGMLYAIGGYGYSHTENDHITFPYLCAIELDGLINAILNEQNIAPYFRQIEDNRLRVTGGYLDYLDQTFYLAGGQNFDGRYNPMGPTHGPGFFQEYTDAIRMFSINDDGTNLSISDYEYWADTANLHRRDYNMVAQIFPNGDSGFTMFSGVFQHDQNLPWLNTVDVTPEGHTLRSGFNQYLNQYHCAHLPIYDDNNNAMHTIFFGGIGRYTLDENDQLVDDPDVPFVKTISQVTRYSDNTMKESKIGEMDGFLGSGSEFMEAGNALFFDNQGILKLSSIVSDTTLVGYIFGGIESTAENIFFTNTGTQSKASSRLFEVYITKDIPTSIEIMNGDRYFKTRLYPNPASNRASLEFSTPDLSDVNIELIDINGRLLSSLHQGKSSSNTISFDTKSLPNGSYIVRLSNDQFKKELKLNVAHD